MTEPDETDDILELTTDMNSSGPSSVPPVAADVVILTPVQLSENSTPAVTASDPADETDEILEMTQTFDETANASSVVPDPPPTEAPAAPSHFDTGGADVPFARISAVPDHHDIALPAAEENTLEGMPVAPELTPPPEEPDAPDDLFELDDQLVVEPGVDRPSPADTPVPHAFDFGTPEMVFDQSEPAGAPAQAADGPDSSESETPTSEQSSGKYISFIPDSPTAAEIADELNAEDLEEDDEPEVELDIGEAELVTPSVDPNAPKPIDSFFKNDITAAEQAASGAFTSSPARRRRGAPQDWWASIFDDEYLMLLPAQSAYEQQKQMDFIQLNLGLPQGTLLLDMACGNGTNAIGMARRNYRMVGVDLSLSMLARAGEAAQEAGQKINFIHGDMRDLGFDKTFDGIICMDTSFGYFDEATNTKVLGSVYKALKPGGVFLLELANRDFVIKQQPNLIWFQMDNMVCMEETDFNYINSRLYITRQLIIGDNQKQTRHEFSLRLYSLHEIGQMMHAAGFAVTKVSGHRASPGAFFGPESSKLIIVAERRGD